MGFFRAVGMTFKAVGLTCKAVGFTAKVGVNVAGGALKGINNTLDTASKVLTDINKGNYDQALEHAGEHLERSINNFGCAVENSARLLDAVANAKSAGSFLSDPKNVKLASAAAGMALGTALAVDLISDDDAGDTGNAGDAVPALLDPSAVDNGMFVGDDADLQELIEAGEDPDAEHIEDVERDLTARDQFLAAHGYDKLPEGYEVHHIKPLSEGGADSQDNMILVTEEQHEAITAAHRAYYHWY